MISLPDSVKKTTVYNFSEIQYIFIEHDNSEETKKSMSWTHGSTLELLHCYNIHKDKIGTMAIRNQKKMWELIANDLKSKNVNVTPSHCENKWRVMERNYKKFIDNNKKTGRGRCEFTYAEEMAEILGKKKMSFPNCCCHQKLWYTCPLYLQLLR